MTRVLCAVMLTFQVLPPSPAFEVVSVKPNTTGEFATSFFPDPAGVNFVNVSARQLILRAYQLQDFQLLGGPDWIDVERYDVVAKRPPNTPGTQNPGMLRQLLADGFKLKVRRETRGQTTYALGVARADGRLGPRLQKSNVDCQPVAAARIQGCATTIRPGDFSSGGTPLPRLATFLSSVLNVIVVDRTGLAGAYDIRLSWEPDAESIFTAVQEQLGLKLEPRRGPVEVMVIEHIEPPMPN